MLPTRTCILIHIGFHFCWIVDVNLLMKFDTRVALTSQSTLQYSRRTVSFEILHNTRSENVQ
jgi:hypothetical protein